MEALQKINAVEGFDPSALAVEYADLNSSGGGDNGCGSLSWPRLAGSG